MIEYLRIIATSWPIAIMVVAAVAGFVINRRIKQAQDDSAAIYNLKTKNAVVVRSRDVASDEG